MRRATYKLDYDQSEDDISIHALREESDTSKVYSSVIYDISIHALREESDRKTRFEIICLLDFYPRSP